MDFEILVKYKCNLIKIRSYYIGLVHQPIKKANFLSNANFIRV